MSTERAALDQHEPMEAAGGYIECSCGWPTREQYEAGEHFVVHVIAAGVVDERERIAVQCQAWAVERFDAHGPGDQRGAAFWDVAAWIREDGAQAHD